MRVETKVDLRLVTFESIDIGDPFGFDRWAYIKIKPVKDNGHDANAISLNDGLTSRFNFADLVDPLNAKVVVE